MSTTKLAEQKLLVTVINEEYIDAAKQLFSSFFHNSSWNGDVMVLVEENGKEMKELSWFSERGIIVKRFNPISDKYCDRLPPVMLGKFLLFKTEFRKWSKVVYLDSDIIVTGDISKLSKVKRIKFSKAPLVTDTLSNEFRECRKMSKQYAFLVKNYDLNKKSFNAGVFAFDTKIIRNDTYHRLMKLYGKYRRIVNFQDQGIFNIFFYNRWEKMSKAYNNTYGRIFGWRRIKKEQGNVLHFVGDSKPWNEDNAYSMLWKHYLSIADNIDFKNSRNLRKRRLINIYSHISVAYFEVKYRFIVISKNIIESLKYKFHKKIKNISMVIRENKKRTKNIVRKTKEFFVRSITHLAKKTVLKLKEYYEILINKNIGRIGKLMKAKSPKIYYTLKRKRSRH